jgi:RND family efflux transporter MFP subunit
MKGLLPGLAAPVTLAIAFTTATASAAVFDCIINPAVVIKLGSPVAGLIDRVFVEPGSLVRTGDRVATLRSEVERITVMLIEERARSTAEIEAQKSRLKLSESRLNRTEQLVRRKISSREALEMAQAESEVIRGELAIAEMRQRVNTLELQRAKEQLAQRTIYSPVDGVVVERHLFSGEFLHQEAYVVTIAQIDPLVVEVFLPVRLYNDVLPGMTVLVRPKEPVNGVYEGRVTVADRVFDAASSTFGIRIHLDNPNLAIPAGHRCEVEIEKAVSK